MKGTVIGRGFKQSCTESDPLLPDENALLVKSKKPRKDSITKDELFQVNLAQRLYKRVLLSFGKPCCVLGLASSSLRSENRIKLTTLLSKFVRLHHWTAATGVLSVLLTDTQNQDPHIHRFNYSVLLKLLQHMEGNCVSARTIGRVFDAWMSRIGINTRRAGSMHEVQLVVRLEAILFHFMQGDVEEERQNARSLMQERELEGHPMFNMIIGLIFYQLWYSGISADMQLKPSNQMHHTMTIPSDMEAADTTYSQSDTIPSDMEVADTCSNSDISASGNAVLFGNETKFLRCDSDMEAADTCSNSDISASGNAVLFSNETKSLRCDSDMEVADTYSNSDISDSGNAVSFSNETKSLRCDSYTSNMKNKQVLDGNGMDYHNEKDGVKELSQHRRGFYHIDSDDEASYDQADDVYSIQGLPRLEKLDLRLRPILSDKGDLEKTIQSEEYNTAVMYLTRAASSTPPVLAALLPLVQLLLIRNDWKEALKVLDNFCCSSSASLPHRLKSRLLEQIYPDNGDLLWKCYEGTLKSDPTCKQSLAKLVRLNELGIYSSESLLEMIAMHLDAANGKGENSAWRELASCFVRVCGQGQEEDRMSSESDGRSVCYNNRIPNFLVNGGESWKVRCKWWKNLYFSKSRLASDIAEGDLERLAYKAACASHLYGRTVRYAVQVYEHMEQDTDSDSDLTFFLKHHMQYSLALNHHFQ